MKKLLFILLMAVTGIAMADRGPSHGPGRHVSKRAPVVNHGHYRHYGGHWERRHNDWVWVVPVLVGGLIIYQATQPRTIVIEKTTEPNCSPWTEIQNPDGTITRTRTCTK